LAPVAAESGNIRRLCPDYQGLTPKPRLAGPPALPIRRPDGLRPGGDRRCRGAALTAARHQDESKWLPRHPFLIDTRRIDCRDAYARRAGDADFIE
jgi:hypothetical protein